MSDIVNWYVSLAGHRHDLRAASACFTLPEACLFESAEFGTCLRSTYFGTLPGASEVELRASEVLRSVNGALRVVSDNYRPIHAWSVHVEGSVGYHHCRDSRDRWHRQNDLDERIGSETRCDEPPRIEDAVRLFRVARMSVPVARAFDLWNADRHGMTVYKIFEIIRNDAGKDLRKLASPTQVSCFTGSVNRPEVLGDYARHEILPGERPRQTMTRDEAERFIQDLLFRWASAKLAQTPTPKD
jgi:hypothetical protein